MIHSGDSFIKPGSHFLLLTSYLLCAGLVAVTGCAPHRPLAEVFPPGTMAEPWALRDAVWTGTFDQAAPGLGDDAASWQKYAPQRVWLAVYEHQQRPGKTMKIRCFSFESTDAAAQAYAAFQPFLPKPFALGDGGAWTDDGVMFRWGRLVFDVFGSAGTWNSEEAALLTAYIAKRMPPGLPDNPR